MKWSRADANQQAIIDALRKTGCLVVSLTRVGRGCPDLLVCKGGRLRLLEVKLPTGKARTAQLEFQAAGWPVSVVRSVDDALALFAARQPTPPDVGGIRR